MKYLFFDIECSNCFEGIGKICEFGYVITDEKFNILTQDVIPMSPGNGWKNDFHLKGRKHQKDLELAWEYDFYREQPEFPFFYERIKAMMTDKETICFGFDCLNDINYLFGTCKRYGLKTFDYVCYDVQQLAINYSSECRTNLKNCYLKLVGPGKIAQFQEHLSRDDALMTMRIFEAICTLSNNASDEVIKNNEDAKTTFNDWLKSKIASEHIDNDAVCNMSDEELKSFNEFVKDLSLLADQNKEKEIADIVTNVDAFQALYIVDNIKFNKDGDVLLFLTSMALLNTYVKQDNIDKRVGYWFKNLLKDLLVASKHTVFKSLKMNYIDKELKGNNIIIFEFNNLYQFSYHCVEKRFSKLIVKEYKCNSKFWGIKNRTFINELFQRVLNNKIGFSNLTKLDENLLENASKFSNELVNNPEIKTRSRSTKSKSEATQLWETLFDEHVNQVEEESSKGKRYTFSSKIKADLEITKTTIELIRNNDIVTTRKRANSDYLVVLDEEDKDRLLQIFKGSYNGTMITVEEFKSKFMK